MNSADETTQAPLVGLAGWTRRPDAKIETQRAQRRARRDGKSPRTGARRHILVPGPRRAHRRRWRRPYRCHPCAPGIRRCCVHRQKAVRSARAIRAPDVRTRYAAGISTIAIATTIAFSAQRRPSRPCVSVAIANAPHSMCRRNSATHRMQRSVADARASKMHATNPGSNGRHLGARFDAGCVRSPTHPDCLPSA
jgi:hypothetical protein